MIARGVLRGWSWRMAIALTVCGLILALVAPATLAAVLAVRVNPATIQVQGSYQIQVSGSFKRRRAYLVAFVQYSSKVCKASASQELHRTHNTGGAFAAGTIRRTPFVQGARFKARSRGTRRACAYLFARRVK